MRDGFASIVHDPFVRSELPLAGQCARSSRCDAQVADRFAAELLEGDSGGVGYLLKDRVVDVEDFVASLRRIAAGAPLVAGLTPRMLGLGVFLGGYALLLQRSRGWLARVDDPERPARMFVLAAAVATWFFFVSTHMHENHLYQALPLLLAVVRTIRRRRRMRRRKRRKGRRRRPVPSLQSFWKLL